MKYIISILAFISIILYTNCRSRDFIKEEIIDTKGTFNNPYLLFSQVTEEGEIGYVVMEDLYEDISMDSLYNGIDIDSIFRDMVSRKYIIEYDYLYFKPDKEIVAYYKNLSFEDFKRKYTYKSQYTSNDIIDYKLSYNQSLTIAYCLYMNNYYTTVSCEDGSFIFEYYLY